jgi:hypothetical protein
MNKQFTSRLHLLLSLAFLFFTTTAHSLESVDFVIEASIQTGDEELVTYFNNFNPDENESIKAGGGLSLQIGANFNLTSSSYIKLLAGIVQDSLSFTIGTTPYEFDWQHYPVDLLYMVQSGNWNFGGGITYHLSPKLTAGGALAGNDVKFDNALGPKIAFDYRFDNNIFLGLEYAFIDYKVNTANTVKSSYSGNSAGIVLGYVFAN